MKDSVAGRSVFANNLGIRSAQNKDQVRAVFVAIEGRAVGTNLVLFLNPAVSPLEFGAASRLRLDSVEHGVSSVTR